VRMIFDRNRHGPPCILYTYALDSLLWAGRTGPETGETQMNAANTEYQAAAAAVLAGEATNLSASTMRRRYARIFKAEDALKATVRGGW